MKHHMQGELVEDVALESVADQYVSQCSGEPIHLLGRIQPHGFVLVVDLHYALLCLQNKKRTHGHCCWCITGASLGTHAFRDVACATDHLSTGRHSLPSSGVMQAGGSKHGNRTGP